MAGRTTLTFFPVPLWRIKSTFFSEAFITFSYISLVFFLWRCCGQDDTHFFPVPLWRIKSTFFSEALITFSYISLSFFLWRCGGQNETHCFPCSAVAIKIYILFWSITFHFQIDHLIFFCGAVAGRMIINNLPVPLWHLKAFLVLNPTFIFKKKKSLDFLCGAVAGRTTLTFFLFRCGA